MGKTGLESNHLYVKIGDDLQCINVSLYIRISDLHNGCTCEGENDCEKGHMTGRPSADRPPDSRKVTEPSDYNGVNNKTKARVWEENRGKCRQGLISILYC